jgi:hypothetical protein
MIREVTVTVRYDPDVDAATLRLDPRRQVVRSSVYVRPPGIRTAAAVGHGSRGRR